MASGEWRNRPVVDFPFPIPHSPFALLQPTLRRPRFLFRAAGFARPSEVAPSNRSEGAWDAGVRKNPRASISRETEAVRIAVPQVRLYADVPRAVF